VFKEVFDEVLKADSNDLGREDFFEEKFTEKKDVSHDHFFLLADEISGFERLIQVFQELFRQE